MAKRANTIATKASRRQPARNPEGPKTMRCKAVGCSSSAGSFMRASSTGDYQHATDSEIGMCGLAFPTYHGRVEGNLRHDSATAPRTRRNSFRHVVLRAR